MTICLFFSVALFSLLIVQVTDYEKNKLDFLEYGVIKHSFFFGKKVITNK
jgi:hypothetical protein